MNGVNPDEPDIYAYFIFPSASERLANKEAALDLINRVSRQPA